MSEPLTEKEREMYKELSETEGIKKIAKELKEKIKTSDLAELIALYLVAVINDKEKSALRSEFVIENLFSLLRTMLLTLKDSTLALIKDEEFQGKIYELIGRKIKDLSIFNL